MARVLLYHAQADEYIAGYPNLPHDEAMVAYEAARRDLTPEEYVADLLAYHWSTGKPAFTLAAKGKDEFAEVAPDAPQPATDKPKVPLGTRPSP